MLQKYMITWKQLVLEEAHANGDAVLNKVYIEHVKISLICFIHELCVYVCVCVCVCVLSHVLHFVTP